ncbi:MAG: TetR/AcrR family transcriptional regulator [Nannocystaceae bacterium]
MDAILEATAQILGSDGAPGLSTNRIAQRAGVSVGTLYQYFEDKEAILRLMCERHVATMRDAVTTQLARAEGTTLETGTRAILEALLHAQTEHRTVNRLLQERVPHLIGVAHLDQIHAMLGTLVREGLAQRVDALRRVDLDLATFLIVNAVFGVSTAATARAARLRQRCGRGCADRDDRPLSAGCHAATPLAGRTPPPRRRGLRTASAHGSEMSGPPPFVSRRSR